MDFYLNNDVKFLCLDVKLYDDYYVTFRNYFREILQIERKISMQFVIYLPINLSSNICMHDNTFHLLIPYSSSVISYSACHSRSAPYIDRHILEKNAIAQVFPRARICRSLVDPLITRA